jgi:hypothetical protein
VENSGETGFTAGLAFACPVEELILASSMMLPPVGG